MGPDARLILSLKDDNFAAGNSSIVKFNITFDQISKAVTGGSTRKGKMTIPFTVGQTSGSLLLTLELIELDQPETVNTINRRATGQRSPNQNSDSSENGSGNGSNRNSDLPPLHDVIHDVTSDIADIESLEAMLDSALRSNSRSSSTVSNSFSDALLKQFDASSGLNLTVFG